MRGHPERTELGLGADDTWAESCCERVEGQTKEGGAGLGVCYGLPDREVDKVFYGQWSRGDCNHPDICWRNGTARHKQRQEAPGKHRWKPPDSGGAGARGERCAAEPCTDKQGGTAWRGGGWEQPWGQIPRGCGALYPARGKQGSEVATLHSRSVKLGLFQDLLGRIEWERVLEGGSEPGELVNIQRWLPAASRPTTRCATTAPSAAAAPQHSAPPTQRCTPNTAAWRWEGQRSLSGLAELSAPTSCVGKQARAKRTSPPPQQA